MGEFMKHKRLFKIAFSLLCLSSVSFQIQSMQAPSQEVYETCGGPCNTLKANLKKYACGHVFCEKCDEACYESDRQLDQQINCHVCGQTIMPGHQINLGPHTHNMYVMNTALRKVLMSDITNLASYMGATFFLGYMCKYLPNKLPLGVTPCIIGGCTLGIAGWIARAKTGYIDQALSLAVNNAGSEILEKRIKAYKNSYYEKTLVNTTAATILGPLCLYGISKVFGWWNRETEYGMNALLLTTSYLNSFILDEATSKYENIPKIKRLGL